MEIDPNANYDRRCNRCNLLRPGTEGFCRCGCPEFTLVPTEEDTMSTELKDQEAVEEVVGESEVMESAAAAQEDHEPTAEEHHEMRLRDMRERLANIALERASMDEQRKTLKKHYDALVEDLAEVQHKGPEYHPLFDGLPKPDEPASWRPTPIEDIEFPDGIGKLLAKAGFETLGQLSDAINRDQWWDAIEGIGQAKAETISDVLAKFWEEHPEFCGDAPAAGPERVRLLVDADEEELASGEVLTTAGAPDDDGSITVFAKGDEGRVVRLAPLSWESADSE